MAKRVVITGLGTVNPLGIGVETSWDAILKGKSGIGEITRFDASQYPSRIAGEVKDFHPEDFMTQKQIKRTDIFIQFALASARMAMEDSKLVINSKNENEVGVVIGCGLGGLNTIEKYHKLLLTSGPHKVTPFFIPMLIANMASGNISIEFGAKGPNSSPATACAAGSHAIGDAYHIIRSGIATVIIAGGVESVITPLAVAGFSNMRALSTRNYEPEKASRPFEKNRDGFVIAEGCGILILEELQHALDRGAKIYAEIVGYGMSGDAYHITAPAPNGKGFALCMEMALEDAPLTYHDVDYINAHGTSTGLNDLYETMAIKAVFKERCKEMPVSSTKSMTGHLLGGAGGLESIFSVLTIRDGIIPPTLNYEVPDPECDLDYVPNIARKAKVDVVMSNTFGFGGTNASLLFKRFEM